MTKAELVIRTAKRAGISQRSANLAIRAAFAIIKEVGHLEYKGFGVFQTVETPVRTFKLGWSCEMGVSLGRRKLVFQESKQRRGTGSPRFAESYPRRK